MAAKRLSSTARREAILTTSVQRFAEGGYAGTSMDDLAAACGISKPVLYDHFPSKEELYLEVLRRIRNTIVERGADQLRQATTIEKGFRAGVRFLLDYAQEHPQETRILFVPPHGEPHLVDRALAIQDGATQQIAAFFKETFPLATSEQQAVAAEYARSGVHAVILWWLKQPSVPIEQIEETLFRVSWSGVSSLVRAGAGKARR